MSRHWDLKSRLQKFLEKFQNLNALFQKKRRCLNLRQPPLYCEWVALRGEGQETLTSFSSFADSFLDPRSLLNKPFCPV
jgi:hypothetical protein